LKTLFILLASTISLAQLSCGTITYSAYLSGFADFDILDTYLTFDPTTRLFSISTIDSSHVGTYTIVIQADTSIGPITNTASTITLTINPLVIILSPPGTFVST